MIMKRTGHSTYNVLSHRACFVDAAVDVLASVRSVGAIVLFRHVLLVRRPSLPGVLTPRSLMPLFWVRPCSVPPGTTVCIVHLLVLVILKLLLLLLCLQTQSFNFQLLETDLESYLVHDLVGIFRSGNLRGRRYWHVLICLLVVCIFLGLFQCSSLATTLTSILPPFQATGTLFARHCLEHHSSSITSRVEEPTMASHVVENTSKDISLFLAHIQTLPYLCYETVSISPYSSLLRETHYAATREQRLMRIRYKHKPFTNCIT